MGMITFTQPLKIHDDKSNADKIVGKKIEMQEKKAPIKSTMRTRK